MITALQGTQRARAQMLLHHGGVVGMRIASALQCYGIAHDACHFYLVDDTAVLMTLGDGALLCGSMADVQELESFLHFAHIKHFQSDRTMLYSWAIVPQLLLQYVGNGTAQPDANITVTQQPNLWALAHSGLLLDVAPDDFYGDTCVRINTGIVDVRAVMQGDRFVATAGVYASDAKSAFVSAVQTSPDCQKQGYATAMLNDLCTHWAKTHTLYLLCAPEKRHFYEKRGFTLAMPMWQFERTDDTV